MILGGFIGIIDKQGNQKNETGENKVRKVRQGILLAAAVMCLMIPGGRGRAEVTAEETRENGKVTSVTWKDENGETAAGPEGYAVIRYTYSGKDKTEERYYDAAGNPWQTAGGYCGKIVTIDGKKRVIGIAYLDADGERTETNMGYARVAMQYTNFGAETRVFYYGLDNKLTMVPALGYAFIETEYSGKEFTSRVYKDVNKKAVDSIDGYAMVRQKLNKSHKVIRTRYEHADGTPALGPDGWSIREMERDDKNRVTKVTYYGTDGNLTDRGAGYAWQQYTYAEDTATETRYDLSGSRVPIRGTVMAVRRRMSGDLILEETYLNEAGEPMSGLYGVSRIAYEYDGDGNLTGTRYYDADGNEIQMNQEAEDGHQ